MKQNTILKAAVALALGAVGVSAFATPTASPVPRYFAAPMFTTDTTAINVAPISYSNDRPLSAASTYYIYVALTNGAKFASIPASSTLVITDPTNVLRLGGADIVQVTNALSADSTYAIFEITTAAGKPLQVNSTITFSAAAGAVQNLHTAGMLTPGTQINANISVGATENLSTIQSDADGVAGGVVAQSVAPITAKLTASDLGDFLTLPATTPAHNYAGQIDAVGSKSEALTNPTNNETGSTTLIDFGGVVFTGVANTVEADGTTLYTTSPGGVFSGVTAGSLGFTVTSSTVGEFNAFTSVTLNTDPTCAGGVFATGAVSTDGSTETFSGATNPVGGTSYYLCGTVNGTTAINAFRPAIASFSLTDTASTTAFSITPALDSTTDPLYNLTLNGGVVITPIYFPAVVTDQKTFVRIINKGYSTISPSVAVIDDTLGTVGTAHALTHSTAPVNTVSVSIPAQGAVLLSQSDIEAVTGTLANIRPRLEFTAPGTLEVQTYVINANGTISEMDGSGDGSTVTAR